MSDGELNENWLTVLEPEKKSVVWDIDRNRPKRVVIFDIDDVLMPWAEKVHVACVEAGLAKADHVWTQWSMHLDYGCTLDEWLEVVNKMVVPGGMYHSPPYPGVVEAINRLDAEGDEIHLVTARGFFDHAEQIRNWTKEWVETNYIPGQLWFSQKKGEVARQISATHAIDDRIENVYDLLNAGVDTYLMNQPHNASEQFDPYRRVDSVPEFVERILKHG